MYKYVSLICISAIIFHVFIDIAMKIKDWLML